jgi:hypothetical protein
VAQLAVRAVVHLVSDRLQSRCHLSSTGFLRLLGHAIATVVVEKLPSAMCATSLAEAAHEKRTKTPTTFLVTVGES